MAERAILSADQLVEHNRRNFNHTNADGVFGRDNVESKKASRAKGLGIKIAKISPGGTV